MNWIKCDGSGRISGGHTPISFEGEFTALCPLCEALEAVEEEKYNNELVIKAAREEASNEVREHANREEARLNDQIDTLRDAVEELEKMVRKQEGGK